VVRFKEKLTARAFIILLLRLLFVILFSVRSATALARSMPFSCRSLCCRRRGFLVVVRVDGLESALLACCSVDFVRCAVDQTLSPPLSSVGGLTSFSDLSMSMEGEAWRLAARDLTDIAVCESLVLIRCRTFWQGKTCHPSFLSWALSP